MAACSVQARSLLSTGQPASVVLGARPRCPARQAKQLKVYAFKTAERGASGLDVNGMRPTSPAAWQIMREQLRARKVRRARANSVALLQLLYAFRFAKRCTARDELHRTLAHSSAGEDDFSTGAALCQREGRSNH